MNALSRWWLRHTNPIIFVCVLVLVFSGMFLPDWAALAVGMIAGALIWHLMHTQKQRRDFKDSLDKIRQEMKDQMAHLTRDKANAVLSLYVHDVDAEPEHLSVTWALKTGLTPMEIMRVAQCLLTSASDLDHLVDSMVRTGTSEYRRGQNPSMN